MALGEGGTPLEKLGAAVRELEDSSEPVDIRHLRSLIDRQELVFSEEAARTPLAYGAASAVTYIGRLCGMSANSAADRLCVGRQLEELPKVAEAVRAGEIGYQSAAVLCHLRDQLSAQRELFNEVEMLEHARNHSVGSLRLLCRIARHEADPDGFFNESEANFDLRRLDISRLDNGNYVVDAILDPEAGAALKTALDPLSKPQGPEDARSNKQRRHDAFSELVHHALDEGRLPRRNGVRPHLSVTTTIEGIKNELGAPAADLEHSLPISTRTVERLSCDCTMSRVLLADSLPIDVGRATRIVSAATRRALRHRDQGCRWPGCDRQVNWSTPHHIIHWSKGGGTNLPNLVLLCAFHHRLVHEGGWQVIKVGRSEFRFLPPDRVLARRARLPDWSRAA